MPVSRLSSLQRDVLLEFFQKEQRFFLTGGAALAGFHLGHRETDDLDLFTTAYVLNEGRQVLEAVAVSLGAELHGISDSPTHKRFAIRRGSENVKIDLVHDTHQLRAKVILDDIIRVDSIEEIAANKLTAILSRSEIRDLVDLKALEAAGVSIEDVMPLAMAKDGGLSPGQLLAVIAELTIGDDAIIPGGETPASLRRYVETLIDRLARLAFPR